MRILIVFMILVIASLAPATENEIKIVEQQGEILIRHGVENDWRAYQSAEKINENDWIKSGANSCAKIARHDGHIFILPGNSIIEAMELKNYTSPELLLILTSIEISNIPLQKGKPIAPSGAYIIHGNRPTDSTAIDSVEVKQYLNYELNGLEALFEQSLWTGVVLKIFKLKKFEKLLDNERVDYQLIVAYRQLNFVNRLRQEKVKFRTKYPNSRFIGLINQLE